MNQLKAGLFKDLTPYHGLVFAGCWLGGVFDGMDASLMSVVLPLAISGLTGHTDKATISQIGAYVTTAFLLGWTLGGVLFGWVGDRFGRVKSMLFAILLYALFTGLAGFSQNWPQLAACRFLTGLGIGGELVSIATFLSEIWPERSRAVAVGVLITAYQAGVLLAGIIHLWIHPWRWVFFVGALPALLVFLLRQTLQESERWEQSQVAHLEATSHWQQLTHPNYRRGLVIGSLAFGGLLVGYWASLAWIPTWIQSLLGTQAGETQRSLATIFQGLAAIIGCISAGFLCDGIGRRWTLLLSSLGCFGASALLFLTNPHFSLLIYYENALLGYFIGLVQAALYIYLPELFPTQIRATAVGFCLNLGRLVTSFAVLFMGVLVMALQGYGQAAFVFALAYLVAAIAIIWGVETRGKPLPA